MVLFGVAPVPFCVVSLFFCWRNGNLAGRFAVRRCCRLFSFICVSMMCFGCKAKEFIFLHAFLPLLSLSGPALERDRPQQRKKTLPTQTQKEHSKPCCESLRQQHPKNNIVLLQRLAPWRRRKRSFNQQPCSLESCYSITLAKVLLFGELLSQKKVAAAISFSEP